MKLHSHRIHNVHEAKLLFTDFKSALDPDKVTDAYGEEPGLSRQLRPWDRLFEYKSPLGKRVAWGRITPDPEESAVWLGVGVWPEHQRLGYRTLVRDHLAFQAFCNYPEFDVWLLRIGVLSTNKEHLIRCYREAHEGGPWKFSGIIFWPEPGFHVFAMKKSDYLRGATT